MSKQNINQSRTSRIIKIRKTVLRAQANNRKKNIKKWKKAYKNRMGQMIKSKIKYSNTYKNKSSIMEKQLLRNKIKIKNCIKIIKDKNNYKNKDSKGSMKIFYNKKRVLRKNKLIIKFKVIRTNKFRKSN